LVVVMRGADAFAFKMSASAFDLCAVRDVE
jgi:hypothetical protein